MKRLSDLGDQLETFRAAADFEMFRPDLDATLAYSDGAQGGRPPFDPVMMFKVLVIQTTNNSALTTAAGGAERTRRAFPESKANVEID